MVAQLATNLPADTGDATESGSIPGYGRSPGEGNGNPLQHPCLGNSMNRGAWLAIVHEVTKSETQFSIHACTNKLSYIIHYFGTVLISFFTSKLLGHPLNKPSN